MEASDAPNPTTPLDEALASARREPSRPNDFYDLFLNSDLLLPVRREGQTEGTWSKVGMKDRFHPFFVPQGEQKLVPVFDTLERLRSWAETRNFDYLSLRCYLLVQLVGADVSLVLNPGTAFSHAFSPEILEKLRRAMKPVTPT